MNEVKFTLENHTLKAKYEFTCAFCGYEQTAVPSVLMRIANINSGETECLSCGIKLHLEVSDDNERMISSVYDESIEATAGEHNEDLPNSN